MTASRRPARRALLFAPYFLPRRRVGAMRPFRFALHLHAFGWRPTVLALAAPGQELTAKETKLLRDVEVVRLRLPFDRSVSSESQLDPAGTSPAEGGATPLVEASAKPSVLERLLNGLDRQFPVDTWLPLFWLKWRRICQVVQRVRPHLLWSTGDPWSGLVVGRWIAQHFDLPWVADFRDPWTLSPVRGTGQSPLTRAVDRRCERRVLERADGVVFAAEQTEQKYRRHYAGLHLRTTAIYNSYDSSVFDDPVADRADDTAAGTTADLDATLDVGFFGRFRALSPAAPIADALAEMRQRHGEQTAAVRVHAFGPLNAVDAHHARRRGVLEHFHRRPAVPLEQALSALRQFDLLLVSTAPERAEIVPAKLWEYLAAGRPVLSLSPNPEVGRLLERTGAGAQLPPERSGEIADVLAGCLRAKRAGEPLPVRFDPQLREIRRFEAHASTGRLARFFDETTPRQ